MRIFGSPLLKRQTTAERQLNGENGNALIRLPLWCVPSVWKTVGMTYIIPPKVLDISFGAYAMEAFSKVGFNKIKQHNQFMCML